MSPPPVNVDLTATAMPQHEAVSNEHQFTALKATSFPCCDIFLTDHLHHQLELSSQFSDHPGFRDFLMGGEGETTRMNHARGRSAEQQTPIAPVPCLEPLTIAISRVASPLPDFPSSGFLGPPLLFDSCLHRRGNRVAHAGYDQRHRGQQQGTAPTSISRAWSRSKIVFALPSNGVSTSRRNGSSVNLALATT